MRVPSDLPEAAAGALTGQALSPERQTGSVVLRALRLLELFTPASPQLTLTEIAERSGYPLTTAHRIVTDLREWGALERDAAGRFHIGLRLWETGAMAPRGTRVREIALPVMEDLSQITHENVQLGVLDDTEVVYLDRIAGRGAVSVQTRVGGRFPATASAIGLALLAHQSPQHQQKVLDGPISRFTPFTVTEPIMLRRMLAEVRRTEVAISDRQVTDDAISVASPIFAGSGPPVAAVALVVAADGRLLPPLVAMIRAAARTVSRALQPGAPG